MPPPRPWPPRALRLQRLRLPWLITYGYKNWRPRCTTSLRAMCFMRCSFCICCTRMGCCIGIPSWAGGIGAWTRFGMPIGSMTMWWIWSRPSYKSYPAAPSSCSNVPRVSDPTLTLICWHWWNNAVRKKSDDTSGRPKWK